MNHGLCLFVDPGENVCTALSHCFSPVLLRTVSGGCGVKPFALRISTCDESYRGSDCLRQSELFGQRVGFIYHIAAPYCPISQAGRQMHLTSSKDQLSLLKMLWIRVSVFFLWALMPATWWDVWYCSNVAVLLQRRRVGLRWGQQQLDGTSCQSKRGQPLLWAGKQKERRKANSSLFLAVGSWASLPTKSS